MFKKITIPIVCLFLVSNVLADTILNKDQIVDILKSLTQRQQKTWIESGAIAAEHTEYQWPLVSDEKQVQAEIEKELAAYASSTDKAETDKQLQQMKVDAIPFNVRYRLTNESTMVSDVVIKYDDGKFLWQIDVKSRTDTVKPSADLQSNEKTEDFKLFSNQKRIFAWDGQKYIRYFSPINHAIITAEPSGVNGPLTAGLTMWGYDNYSLEKLSAATISGFEKQVDGKTLLEISIINGDIQETITLDPAKNYATLEKIIVKEKYKTVTTLQDYQLVAGSWCPKGIAIETTDITDNRLISRDIWQINSIDTKALADEDFNVQYETNSLIEDLRFGEPLQYNTPSPEGPSVNAVDIEKLIGDRLNIVATTENKPNCAAIALKVASDRLGITGDFTNIANLIDNAKTTNMLTLGKAAEKLGLYSLAVKVDITQLSQMKDCQIILYLPKENHYVVFGGMDNRNIHLINLDSKKFYYSKSVEQFAQDWQGTAMIVSKQNLKDADFALLGQNELEQIFGAATCSACNTTIQSSTDIPCVLIGSYCTTHRITYARLGCGPAQSGSCSTSTMIGGIQESCTNNGGSCTGNGNWTSYYISACG